MSSSQIAVRLFRSGDEVLLPEVIRTAYSSAGVPLRECEIVALINPGSWFRNKLGDCWVCEARGALSGSIAIAPVDEEIWEVSCFCLSESYRGLSIAPLLMEQALSFVKHNGGTCVCAGVAEEANATRRFMVKAGFTLATDFSVPLENGYEWYRLEV